MCWIVHGEQAQPPPTLHVLVNEMQLSPHGFDFVGLQCLQHACEDGVFVGGRNIVGMFVGRVVRVGSGRVAVGCTVFASVGTEVAVPDSSLN